MESGKPSIETDLNASTVVPKKLVINEMAKEKKLNFEKVGIGAERGLYSSVVVSVRKAKH